MGPKKTELQQRISRIQVTEPQPGLLSRSIRPFGSASQRFPDPPSPYQRFGRELQGPGYREIVQARENSTGRNVKAKSASLRKRPSTASPWAGDGSNTASPVSNIRQHPPLSKVNIASPAGDVSSLSESKVADAIGFNVNDSTLVRGQRNSYYFRSQLPRFPKAKEESPLSLYSRDFMQALYAVFLLSFYFRSLTHPPDYSDLPQRIEHNKNQKEPKNKNKNEGGQSEGVGAKTSGSSTHSSRRGSLQRSSKYSFAIDERQIDFLSHYPFKEDDLIDPSQQVAQEASQRLDDLYIHSHENQAYLQSLEEKANRILEDTKNSVTKVQKNIREYSQRSQAMEASRAFWGIDHLQETQERARQAAERKEERAALAFARFASRNQTAGNGRGNAKAKIYGDIRRSNGNAPAKVASRKDKEKEKESGNFPSRSNVSSQKASNLVERHAMLSLKTAPLHRATSTSRLEAADAHSPQTEREREEVTAKETKTVEESSPSMNELSDAIHSKLATMSELARVTSEISTNSASHVVDERFRNSEIFSKTKEHQQIRSIVSTGQLQAPMPRRTMQVGQTHRP